MRNMNTEGGQGPPDAHKEIVRHRGSSTGRASSSELDRGGSIPPLGTTKHRGSHGSLCVYVHEGARHLHVSRGDSNVGAMCDELVAPRGGAQTRPRDGAALVEGDSSPRNKYVQEIFFATKRPSSLPKRFLDIARSSISRSTVRRCFLVGFGSMRTAVRDCGFMDSIRASWMRGVVSLLT